MNALEVSEDTKAASIAMLAQIAAALQTHHRDIKSDKDFAFEQLRHAMLELGVKKYEFAGVLAEIKPGRRFAIRTEKAHIFKLVRWPYVKVTVIGEKRPVAR